jgi:hypothetical protein
MKICTYFATLVLAGALAGCVGPVPQQALTGAPYDQPAPAPRAAAFQLKEFQIGQPMSACPETFVQSLVHDGMTICVLGATTLANQPVTAHSVYIYEGRVSGANFDLASKGRYEGGQVKRALIERYGHPTSDKPHINQAIWFRGAQILRFDGWGGSVGILDRDASARASKGSALRNKSDL